MYIFQPLVICVQLGIYVCTMCTVCTVVRLSQLKWAQASSLSHLRAWKITLISCHQGWGSPGLGSGVGWLTMPLYSRFGWNKENQDKHKYEQEIKTKNVCKLVENSSLRSSIQCLWSLCIYFQESNNFFFFSMLIVWSYHHFHPSEPKTHSEI